LEDFEPVSPEILKKTYNLYKTDGELIRENPQKSQGIRPQSTEYPNGFPEKNLGPLNVGAYLSHYGIGYRESSDSKGIKYYPESGCINNPDHKGRDAYFFSVNGIPGYHCSHDSCSGFKWAQARARISGEDSLARFCEGYDPEWKPEKSRQKSAVPEQTSEVPRTGEIPAGKLPPYIRASKKGGLSLLEKSCLSHMEGQLAPIMWDGVESFWKYGDSGVWERWMENRLSKLISDDMGDHSKIKWVNTAIEAAKSHWWRNQATDDYSYKFLLNLKNGMLDIHTM
jgi:hypothetical protein